MKSNNQNEPKRNPLKDYLRFSTAAIQMGAIIGLSAWLGTWLDGRMGNEKPMLTILLSLLGVFAGLFLIYKEVRDLDKDE